MLFKVAQILAQPRAKKWQKRGEVGGGVVEQEGAGMAGASAARSRKVGFKGNQMELNEKEKHRQLAKLRQS